MSEHRPLNSNIYRDRRGGTLSASDVGSTVRLAGWIAAKRDHGGLLFLDLRDPGGVEPGEVVQLVINPEQVAFETLTHLRVESVISVTGRVVARSEATVNPRITTGQVEVAVDDAEI